MSRGKQIPSYCLHRPTGQARVRLSGRDHYLGRYGSLESQQAYSRLIAQYCRPGCGTPSAAPPAAEATISINELFLRYLTFANSYYVRDGVPSGEVKNLRDAMRSVRALYQLIPAHEFGPLALKAVRQHMMDVEKLSRNVINARINRIRRIFKWAVSEQLIPASVLEGLRAVDGLRQGRSAARETKPVGPVEDAVVEATLKFLPPQVSDMVRLQRLTSMRPGNVVNLRWMDVDCSGSVWFYHPHTHKSAYLGRKLVIPLGPKAQAVLGKYVHRPSHRRRPAHGHERTGTPVGLSHRRAAARQAHGSGGRHSFLAETCCDGVVTS